jgi:hypothetical protein
MVGLLKFAQEAPDLFKELFGNAKGLFSGIDLDPRHGMNDMVKTTGRIGSTVAGAAGGLAGGVARGFQNAGADYDANRGLHFTAGRALHTMGASLGGGLRGLVRGGVNGARNGADSPTPHNMYNQFMGGIDRGETSAAQASQSYREGDSTFGPARVIRRAGHRLRDGWHDHVAEPYGDVVGALSNGRNSSEIAELNTRMKSNNDAILVATGGKKDDDALKEARDTAKAKVREGQAAGASIEHVMQDLGIDPTSFQAREANGDPRWRELREMIDTNYRNQRNEMLRERYDGNGNNRMSDQRIGSIQQYNDETIRDFERNAALLSEQSLSNLLNRMDGQTIGRDANGAPVLFTVDANDLNGSLRRLIGNLDNMNRDNNIRAQGVDLMNDLTRIQGQMDIIGNDIQTERTLREHQHANHGGNNNDTNNGGSNNGGN